MKRSLLLLLATTFLLFHITTWSRTLDEIRQDGTLKIGVAKFSPWVMSDNRGELIGSEIDLATRLASDLGVTEEFVELPWEGLIPALEEGRLDVIISGMSITPTRALRVDFTRPYGESVVGMLARRQSAVDRSTLEAFDKQELKIGAVQGTLSSDLAHLKFHAAQVMEYPELTELVGQLSSGELDAIIVSQPLPHLMSIQHPETFAEPIAKPLHRQVEAIAVNRGNQSLLNFLNAWIEVKRADGFLHRTHDYWFKRSDWLALISSGVDDKETEAAPKTDGSKE